MEENNQKNIQIKQVSSAESRRKKQKIYLRIFIALIVVFFLSLFVTVFLFGDKPFAITIGANICAGSLTVAIFFLVLYYANTKFMANLMNKMDIGVLVIVLLVFLVFIFGINYSDAPLVKIAIPLLFSGVFAPISIQILIMRYQNIIAARHVECEVYVYRNPDLIAPDTLVWAPADIDFQKALILEVRNNSNSSISNLKLKTANGSANFSESPYSAPASLPSKESLIFVLNDMSEDALSVQVCYDAFGITMCKQFKGALLRPDGINTINAKCVFSNPSAPSLEPNTENWELPIPLTRTYASLIKNLTNAAPK